MVAERVTLWYYGYLSSRSLWATALLLQTITIPGLSAWEAKHGKVRFVR
jgi:hypothetical protein